MPRICINLAFDEATELVIRGCWQQIANTGLFVRGLTGYRPHITLAVYEVEQPLLYESILESVVSGFEPFPILLESLGIFPESGVIFLAPRVPHTLVALHRTMIQAFMDFKEPLLVDDLLLPDRWSPHVTLAGQLTTPQILQGLETCLHSWTPIRGYATGIGMRIYPDLSDYCSYAFRDQVHASNSTGTL